ncbi:unnamed protein product [Rotaria sordida]|uniref:Uncharacterized protein n=1 Tax=Rotaria sordida TaxID=392033 RepID=A0A813N3A8_9BILA|nr:unnamed protein product [Rotaria sordida]CAF0758139.1 unnamed protein product [Rotaria sordida]
MTRFIYLIASVALNDGYVRTYADVHYGRIRGRNQATNLDPAIVFLILFGCLVGGFFIVCIFGTLILGFFDNGFRNSQRSFLRRNTLSN